jgi:hypothetical protein
MGKPERSAVRFFGIVWSRQAYLNTLYVLAAFPLGVLYFAFLVSVFSAGLALSIVWVGVPVLLLAVWTGRVLGRFERYAVVHVLGGDIPAAPRLSTQGVSVWTWVREGLADPITWKSLLYLFLKFPIGTAGFTVLSVAVLTTAALLTAPLTYQSARGLEFGLFLGSSLPAWRIDSMGDALVGALVGLILWPVTLHVAGALAWLHTCLARWMLCDAPLRCPALPSRAKLVQ